MQISFGKFVPVSVFLNGKPAGVEERDKITKNLCSILRNDPHAENTYLSEQQRRFFAAEVSDYRAPTSKFKRGLTDASDVTTLNIKGQGRYLVTGKETTLKNEFGRDYNHRSHEINNNEENYVQLGLIDEITALNQAEARAKTERQNKLNKALENNKLNKTLCINAIEFPEAKTDKERYKIALIDFKA